MWVQKKYFGSLGQKKNLDKKNFGKQCLCVIIRFLVFSDIADFDGVLLVLVVVLLVVVLVVLLVTGVKQSQLLV